MDSRPLIFAALVALAACRGPHAEVTAASVEPSPEPGRQRVAADVENAGGGHGQLDLEITLVGASGHRIRTSHAVELRAHETLHVVVDVPAPPEHYTVEVEPEYPD
jgi:hypothetical protein